MNKIKENLLETELVKRLQALEKVLDQNEVLRQYIDNLKQKQKQMVHAKEFNQQRQYQVYYEEYQNIYHQILEFPFVEEYIALLEEVNDILLTISGCIETTINQALEG